MLVEDMIAFNGCDITCVLFIGERKSFMTFFSAQQFYERNCASHLCNKMLLNLKKNYIDYLRFTY